MSIQRIDLGNFFSATIDTKTGIYNIHYEGEMTAAYITVPEEIPNKLPAGTTEISLDKCFADRKRLTNVCFPTDFIEKLRIKSCIGMFLNCESLTNVMFLAPLNFSACGSCAEMFKGCIRLSDFSGLYGKPLNELGNVHHMFAGTAITSLDFLKELKFGHNRPNNAACMFAGCTQLVDVDYFLPFLNEHRGINIIYAIFDECRAAVPGLHKLMLPTLTTVKLSTNIKLPQGLFKEGVRYNTVYHEKGGQFINIGKKTTPNNATKKRSPSVKSSTTAQQPHYSVPSQQMPMMQQPYGMQPQETQEQNTGNNSDYEELKKLYNMALHDKRCLQRELNEAKKRMKQLELSHKEELERMSSQTLALDTGVSFSLSDKESVKTCLLGSLKYIEHIYGTDVTWSSTKRKLNTAIVELDQK